MKIILKHIKPFLKKENCNHKDFHSYFFKFDLFRIEKGILVFGQIPDIVFGLTRKKVVQNSNLQGVTNASGLKLVVT